MIIGGGFAGATSARILENEFDVTLIDSKNYFEFTPGVLQAIVEPEHLKRIQSPHKNYLKKAKVVVGMVKELCLDYVKVNNKKIYFDYALLCTGSRYSPPFKEFGSGASLRSDNICWTNKILTKANSVLVIGGGLVGVEIAAEIVEKYPEKKITIVHSGSKIMERYSDYSRDYCQRWLRDHKIKIMTGQFVHKRKGKMFITKKGLKINADIVFVCTGIVPNTEYIKGKIKEKLILNGKIQVNKFLQTSAPNIFSAGDANSIEIEKTAHNAERQAKIAAYNIIALERKMRLREYNTKKTILIISLGNKIGVIEHPNFTIGGLIPGFIKKIIEFKEMRKVR